LNGITFEIQQREIFELLGPHDAGKFTAVNVLCACIEPATE
jgi:ABC-type multidrug transport system ATPase subunit